MALPSSSTWQNCLNSASPINIDQLNVLISSDFNEHEIVIRRVLFKVIEETYNQPSAYNLLTKLISHLKPIFNPVLKLTAELQWWVNKLYFEGNPLFQELAQLGKANDVAALYMAAHNRDEWTFHRLLLTGLDVSAPQPSKFNIVTCALKKLGFVSVQTLLRYSPCQEANSMWNAIHLKRFSEHELCELTKNLRSDESAFKLALELNLNFLAAVIDMKLTPKRTISMPAPLPSYPYSTDDPTKTVAILDHAPSYNNHIFLRKIIAAPEANSLISRAPIQTDFVMYLVTVVGHVWTIESKLYDNSTTYDTEGWSKQGCMGFWISSLSRILKYFPNDELKGFLEILKRYSMEDYKLPTFSESGHYEHTSFWLYTELSYYYCDRSSRSSIHQYKGTYIDETFLQEQRKRAYDSAKTSLKTNAVVKRLHLTHQQSYYMKPQKTGTCSHTSMESMFFAYLINNRRKKGLPPQKAHEDSKPLYKFVTGAFRYMTALDVLELARMSKINSQILYHLIFHMNRKMEQKPDRLKSFTDQGPLLQKHFEFTMNALKP